MSLDELIKGKMQNPPVTQQSLSTTLLLSEITDRPSGDTRTLKQSHVEALSESIAAVGLIQPIAVDNKGRLLAGGHRRAAIYHLKESNPEAFNKHFSVGIPIRQYDFDATQDAEMALAIEATENEKRRDYTPAEVRELANRLKAAGYQFQQGGQKKGAKGVAPTLAIIVGKSQRTIERYLSKADNPTDPTHVGFIQQSLATARSIQKLLDCKDIPDDVSRDAAKLLKKLERQTNS
jgi:ParB family transcriptional regulator, chromosome partitioning protein